MSAESFAYDRAEWKHRTGQELTEVEWETLLAGERAAREALEGAHEDVAALENTITELEARIDELEARVGG